MNVNINRRQMLKVTAAGTAGVVVPKSASAQACVAGEGTVRDRMWLFAVPPNTDFRSLKRRSLMTATEGALYLGVPNVIMVQASEGEAKYGRFEPPFEQYVVPLRPFRRVAWSLVGSGGFTTEAERQEGLTLAKKTPNITSVMFDDFFTGKASGERAILTLEETTAIMQQLKSPQKTLESMVTYYVRFLNLQLADYLKLFDVLTLWSIAGKKELEQLEANFAKIEEIAPGKRKMLGLYMVDYQSGQSLPLDLMQMQCQKGLEWLRNGRIEGLIFLGNTCMDLEFEAVEWAREWIKKVGDQRL
ncbi:MAG: hypothetical protein LLG20_15640 [Acidobacteriales bacterium]|nr:hypothetical protein [Terriglobales bacterium]